MQHKFFSLLISFGYIGSCLAQSAADNARPLPTPNALPSPLEQPAPANLPAPGSAAPATAGAATANPNQAQPAQPVPCEQTQVAVLGYHDFSSTKAVTDMRMRTEEFRKQMQAIRDSGYRVISLSEFAQWKSGKLQLPPFCVLITIDDGWKSVYTDAYPILKEFGYPFVIFAYTNFINNGGATLTHEMLGEMIANGATLQSHSTSHPYPSKVKAAARKGAEEFHNFLKGEMLDSKTTLEQISKQPVYAYCYPGGYNNADIHAKGLEFGYQLLFTVNPTKTKFADNNAAIPRHIIYGNLDSTFTNALRFSSTVGTASAPPTSAGGNTTPGATGNATVHAPAKNPSFPLAVTPAPGSSDADRLATISIPLEALGDYDVSSLELSVTGFGKVPASYNPDTKVLSWKPVRPLRHNVIEAVLRFKKPQEKTWQTPLSWQFSTKSSLQEPQVKGLIQP